jgi:hypothetical protein
VAFVDGVHANPADGLGVDQAELRQRLQYLLDCPQALVIADERCKSVLDRGALGNAAIFRRVTRCKSVT